MIFVANNFFHIFSSHRTKNVKKNCSNVTEISVDEAATGRHILPNPTSFICWRNQCREVNQCCFNTGPPSATLAQH